jgi:ribosomal protein L12E/L44/L45/RPP1/RPP2
MVDSPPPGAYVGAAGKQLRAVAHQPSAHSKRRKAEDENEDDNEDEDEDDGCRPA